MALDTSANIERFSGFSARYDKYRPTAPPALLDVLTQWAQEQQPKLVVDLGSGTGLSTRIWAGRAEQVIGIEPNDDMRQEAQKHGSATTENVSYRAASASNTGLEDGCADIVTCSQSLHWMEPQPTLAEIGRILRDGGVFAAYDNDWPPTMHWQVEAAYMSVMDNVQALTTQHGVGKDVVHWPKDEHLKQMKASGHFRLVREIFLHHTETGNAERLVGLAQSQGAVMSLLKHGLSEEEIGIDKLRVTAQRCFAGKTVLWTFCYRVRLGVK